MNKVNIKTYAIWARNELISRVSQKAYEYGVEKDNIVSSDADSINGRLLSNDEKNKRIVLITQVTQKGYDQVMEEVAYTWFNRFVALRFMEVNNYLPNKVRLFTNENNEFKPQILEEALHIDLLGLDKNKIISLKEANNNEELYKELLLATCNDMSQYLPGMFKPIDDYMTLLFPSNLLRDESVLGRLISDIDEDSWNDQVQIIGWLYQYYVSEKHDEVIDSLHGKFVSKEEIPAATQLFTTDWIVRYMVDNSLGRYWMERNPDSPLKSKMSFFSPSKNHSDNLSFKTVRPESIKFIDPCMGSGHILVYAFDIFMQIYVSEGWTEREAAKSILQNNLYGLDIDERAYQLSYFALMMKARQYNRRILSEKIYPNVVAIEESNTFNKDLLVKFRDLKPVAERVVDIFTDAKEYGSILNLQLTKDEISALEDMLREIHNASFYESLVDQLESDQLQFEFYPLLKQAKIMSQSYECVVTNPPYLSKMGGKLKQYVNDKYKDVSSDLFSVFIKKNFDYATTDGYLGFMTPFVWMFIKSYEKLRYFIIENKSIVSLIQLEYSAYDEATVPICTFVLSNNNNDKVGSYFRLSDFKGGMNVQRDKVLKAINDEKCSYYYESNCLNFLEIPGAPLAYWISNSLLSLFERDSIVNQAKACIGMRTGDNDRFLRVWFEVNRTKLLFGSENALEVKRKGVKWIPYNKGGEYRKWYGNHEYVVNWENDGYEIKENTRKVYPYLGDNLGWKISNEQMYFKKHICWTDLTTKGLSFRDFPVGFIFDASANVIFPKKESDYYGILAFLNSKVVEILSKIINPTMHFKLGNFNSLPGLDINAKNVGLIAEHCVDLSRLDWDSFEVSWNFKKHPLLRGSKTINDSFKLWSNECEERFNHLKSNEEELNRIFIDIYGLQDELTPEVDDKYVSVRKADLQREIKSLISYAVGCMFGRYSLDLEGLAYAGGEWDDSKYKSFIPDKDNIIPICDDEYFEDDIVGKFIDFIKAAYGEDTLEENLQYIADALGGKGTSREVIRNYFLNDFFKDHCNTYQVTGSGKRPIYWQFDSGKKNGFKALVYIHRYTPDLIARMRTSYVHEQQSRYENQISMIQSRIDNAGSTSERVKDEKELKKLKEQAEELRVYEEKIHHWADKMEPMDQDDGVKANYAKFQELLAKIK